MAMTVLTNARIFDGESDELIDGKSVYVEGDRISEVSDRPVTPDDGEIVDCGGRILMPGMIDAHIHAYFYDLNVNRMQRIPVTLYAHHAANMLAGFSTGVSLACAIRAAPITAFGWPLKEDSSRRPGSTIAGTP